MSLLSVAGSWAVIAYIIGASFFIAIRTSPEGDDHE